MIISVGQLVEHQLALYGMYLFSFMLFIATVMMSKKCSILLRFYTKIIRKAHSCPCTDS